jgi:hypothetical protein
MKLTLAVLVGICLIWSTSHAKVHGYANQGRVAVGKEASIRTLMSTGMQMSIAT